MANGLTKSEAESLQTKVESTAEKKAQMDAKTAIAIGFLAGRAIPKLVAAFAPTMASNLPTLELAGGGYGLYRGMMKNGKKSGYYFGGGLALISGQVDALVDKLVESIQSIAPGP